MTETDSTLACLVCWGCGGSGTRREGRGRCYKCDGTGSVFWVNGYAYPYTPRGEHLARSANAICTATE